jgi:UDP-N-acetylglucosamine 2-epimerase (non-hydrolysing)
MAMSKLKIMSVFGTRPEAIKMCPLALELQTRPEIESLVCVTAQHREMLDSVLDCFHVKPDYDLDIMEPGQTLSGVTSKILGGMGSVFETAKPDLVLVHGDTTTTFSAALAAFYHRIPVGHVEAGLRTFDRYSPFPEEMNRCMVGRLAECHFAPTAQNAENLRREGITEGVFITGNTVIDAMRYTVGAGGGFTDPTLRQLDFDGRRVIAMTCHRRENYGEPMENIFSAVRDVAEAFSDVEIVYPVHLSPVVREAAHRHLDRQPNIHLIEPLDAMEMHRLMSRSYLVMTDSGGIQEEAPALGKPVLVLRRETERPEAVAAGTVELAGVERNTIFRLASQLLTDEAKYQRMARAVNPYGDGSACRRIADAILYRFGYSCARPEDFRP